MGFLRVRGFMVLLQFSDCFYGFMMSQSLTGFLGFYDFIRVVNVSRG
jgi:hypothetical protein